MRKFENPMEWMQSALELARQAQDADEVPVGAIVVLDDKIIGRGSNHKESAHDPCGHAEIIAIRDAAKALGNWRLIGSKLVVTLEPCPMCLAACQQARISEVIFGARDPKGGAISLGYTLHQDERLNHRFEVRYEAEPESEKLLKDFFKKKRR